MSGSPLNPETFVLLIARNERRIRGFIATLLPFDRSAIDDLVQATYLVAWRKLPEFRYEGESPEEEAVRWIIAIARFETFSYLRNSKKHEHAVLNEAVAQQIADVQADDWSHFEARWRAFAGCVQKLDDSHREVIRLRYGQGLSLEEIGARQGKRPNTVAVTMSRLRRALERCINTTMQAEGSR